MHDPIFQRARVLTGPTGSGKTRLALDLAETLNAEIVSMDSMAIYRGMAISAARLHENDFRRITRALEVWELTQMPISSWQTQWTSDTREVQETPQVLWLDMPREELYKRINARVKAMFHAGLVDEVMALHA